MDLKNLKKEYRIKKDRIKENLKKFKSVSEDKWIDELIFCTLTPQSNAQKCWQAVREIKKISEKSEESIKNILRTKTRFHNNKTNYILHNLNNWNGIKNKINKEKLNPIELRNWLSENIKGYGLKEASHFLRNIGLSNNKITILDRHILKNLKELKIIDEDKIKNKRDYLEKEKRFINFSKEVKIPIDELDLLFWSNENGEIFK